MLDAGEKALGPEHPDTAMSLNNLAFLHRAHGDFPAARPLYERALAIREKVLGPEHPDTATSLNNLASLHQARGDLPAARPLLERALCIYEKTFGPEHPDTAMSLNNLGPARQSASSSSSSRSGMRGCHSPGSGRITLNNRPFDFFDCFSKTGTSRAPWPS